MQFHKIHHDYYYYYYYYYYVKVYYMLIIHKGGSMILEWGPVEAIISYRGHIPGTL